MSTSTKASIVVPNGNAKTNSGFRQVVLTPGGTVRPVQSAVRSGYRPDRCTNQVAREGDLVIRVTWYPEYWGISKVLGGVLTDLGHQGLIDYQPLIRNLSKEVEAFLQPTAERKESFLPAGCGWDGVNTQADLRKKERLEAFLRGADPYWIGKVVAQAMRSSGQGLPTNWAHAQPMPKVMDAPAKRWDGAMVDIERYTQWLLIDDEGNYSIVNPEPTSGDWGSNYAHSASGEYNYPPMPIPANTVKAVKITRGAYEHEHHSHGVKWELFKR